MASKRLFKLNGLIKQWGNINDSSISSVNFPLSFSNSMYTLVCKPYGNNSRDKDISSNIYPKTTTDFTYDTAPGYGGKYYFTWIAKGY